MISSFYRLSAILRSVVDGVFDTMRAYLKAGACKKYFCWNKKMNLDFLLSL